MFEPHYRPDPRLPGMGLAFFRADLGGVLAVEHQGVMPGFNSQIFLAPDRGVAVMAFTNGAKDAEFWLTGASAALLRRLLGVPDDVVRTDVPHHPEVWGELCGWYRLSAQLLDVRLRAFLGAGVEVFVRGGRLMLRFLTPVPALYRGLPLHPDDGADPYVFRLDMSEAGSGTTRVAFSREPGAGMAVHTEMMPLVLRKQPAATNPRLWATGALGAVGATTAAIAVRRFRR
jgi:hypothetical protein